VLRAVLHLPASVHLSLKERFNVQLNVSHLFWWFSAAQATLNSPGLLNLIKKSSGNTILR
ncbi:MAG: hypothetical protein AABZ85_06880, partial [Thermodesulfobacteriota bacterium]